MSKRFLPTVLISVVVLSVPILGFLVFLYGGKTIVATNVRAASNSEANQEIEEYVVKNGDTFSTVMESFGLSGADVERMLSASKQVYDFTSVKADHILRMVFVQHAFAAVEYVVTDHKIVTVEKKNGGFSAAESDIVYDIEPAVAEATVTSSLFLDGAAVGLDDSTLIELANLFAWDIDFTTDIREGDSFKIVYEKRSRDGKPAKPGKILGAWFENQGEKYWALSYKGAGGEDHYYDLEGRSVARQFLKSALDYSYVSSAFTNRRINPVTKKIEAHRAVDLAAPQGTPVVATGDGTVSSAGWKGGYGINVEIKHGGSYTTQYAHLSKIGKGIGVGSTVQQGQVIGYVGSTGISTGPHLHFAMTKDGTALDPLNYNLPGGESLGPKEKEDFDRQKEALLSLLN